MISLISLNILSVKINFPLYMLMYKVFYDDTYFFVVNRYDILSDVGFLSLLIFSIGFKVNFFVPLLFNQNSLSVFLFCDINFSMEI